MRFRNLLLIGLLLSLLLFGWKGVQYTLFALNPAGGAKVVEIIEVHPGHKPYALSRDLQAKGIVSDAYKLYRLGSLIRQWRNLKVGEYELHSHLSPVEVLSVLTSGKSVARPLTIQEGKNLYQISEALERLGFSTKKAMTQLFKDPSFIASLKFDGTQPTTLEGYLFPDTYHFTKRSSAKDIARTMVQRFRKSWTPALAQRAKELGFSRHQVVTLASMIEKETGAAHERKVISSVFHNRLKKKMRLQSDPTTIYGIWEGFNGNLRRSHLKEKNDYNTYAMRGLPKGPIANPGSESLTAALYPDETPYLYFVSKNDGTHVFSTNFKDHNKAVKDYQLNRAARKGKSWRDLHKKKAKK